MTDKSHLIAGLKKMGFSVKEGTFKVEAYGSRAECELVIDPALGFSKQRDGTYAIVGDPYHAQDKKVRNYYNRNSELQSDVMLSYVTCAVTDALASAGHYVSETVENSEELVLTANTNY